MNPEELLDKHGGLMIRPPAKEEPHYCDLPENHRRDVPITYRDLLAYRAACGHWWRPVCSGGVNWDWCTVSRWRLWRWRRKGLIPLD